MGVMKCRYTFTKYLKMTVSWQNLGFYFGGEVVEELGENWDSYWGGSFECFIDQLWN